MRCSRPQGVDCRRLLQCEGYLAVPGVANEYDGSSRLSFLSHFKPPSKLPIHA